MITGRPAGIRRWVLLGCLFAIAGSSVATAFSIRVPVAYEATARVQPSWRLPGTIVTVDKVDAYAASLGTRLKTDSNLAAVITKLQLPYTPSTLASNITVAADASHQEQIDVTVTDHSASRSSAIANAVVAVYIAQSHPQAEIIWVDAAATTPTSPVRPNPPLQALAGLLVGFAIVFALFHALRRADAVRAQPQDGGGPIVRVVARYSPAAAQRWIGPGLAIVSGAALLIGAALAGARSDPTLTLLGFVPLLLVAVLVSPMWRLVALVVGGLVVFQSSQTFTFAKVTYLVTAAVIGVVSAVTVFDARRTAIVTRLRPLLYAAVALAALVAVSMLVARLGGTGTLPWARDAAPYALLCLALLLAVDVSASRPARTVVELGLLVCGVAAGLAYANAWLEQRDYGALPLNVPVLQSFLLSGALFAYATSQVIAGRRRAMWAVAAIAVGFLLFVTGSRATLLIVAGPVAVALWEGPVKTVAAARRTAVGLAPAAAAAALTAAFLYISTASPPGTAANAASPPATVSATSTPEVVRTPAAGPPGVVATAPSPQALQTKLIAGRFEKILSIASDASFTERLTVDRLAWFTFIRHPVFGVGPGHLFQWPTPSGQVKVSPYLDTGLSVLAKFGLAAVPVLVLLAIALASVFRDRRLALAPRSALLGYCIIAIAWMTVEAPLEDKGFGLGLAMLLVLALTAPESKQRVAESETPMSETKMTRPSRDPITIPV